MAEIRHEAKQVSWERKVITGRVFKPLNRYPNGIVKVLKEWGGERKKEQKNKGLWLSCIAWPLREAEGPTRGTDKQPKKDPEGLLP